MSEWDKSIEKLVAELNSLLEEKRALEEKLSRLKYRIDSVVQAATILEELAGRTPSVSGALGETVSDKIRHVVLRSEIALTAVEIMGQLARLGFNFPGDPRPLATTHSILRRLTTSRKPLIEEAPDKNNRKAWRRRIDPKEIKQKFNV